MLGYGRRLRRNSLLAVALAATLVAWSPAGASAAHAGGPRRQTISIVAPRPGALRTTRTVTVEVRTGRPDARLQVTMYGKGPRLRRVSKLFRRVAPGRFVARLRVGRQLRYGTNRLFVDERGRQVGTESTFTVARPVSGLLVAGRTERGPVEVPPLNLRVQVRAARATVWAKLNGHPARGSFEPIGPRRWRAALGPKDGLRYGRNRLVVTAFTASGRYQRVRRVFLVRRNRPIADAGRDRRGRVGQAVRLDGSASMVAPRGDRLGLRWRIVRKPKGSHPRLRDARSAHPRLRADLNGTYRLRVQASSPARPGVPRSTASASRVGAAEENPASAGESASPTTSDETVVDVAPAVPPTGVPVRTMAVKEGSPGIEVGGSLYPMGAGTVVQLLALDRKTLEPRLVKSYAGGETGQLLEAVKGLESGDLAILSGGGQSDYGLAPAAIPAATRQVREAIDAIGGIASGDQAVGVSAELEGEGHGGWSVIGVPQLDEGQAYQMVGLEQAEGEPIGGMRGSFQIDSTGVNFAFAWAPEYHPFDTEAAATATENTMEVDGKAWPSWNLPFPGEAEKTGFQLLWFDADTMKPRLSASFEADLWAPEEEQGKGLWPLRNDLRQILADPKPGLLMLHTIGKVETPTYTNSETVGGNKVDGNDIRGNVLGRIASLLQEFGANPYVFDTFGTGGFGGKGTPGGYTLVGVTGLRRMKGPNAGAERSTQLVEGSTARLTGALQRDRQGVLEPASTNAPGPQPEAGLVQPQLSGLLDDPGPPFPTWSELSPAEQKAQIELGEKLGISFEQRLDGIRNEYWKDPEAKWDTLAGELKTICDPTKENAEPCSAAAAELAPGLAKEFEAVGRIRPYFETTLWNIFSSVFLQEEFGVVAVTNEVRGLFQPPREAATTGPDALGILGGVLGIAGGIGEFVPIAGEAIGPAAEVTEGLTEVIAASTAESGGEPSFDPFGFHSTTAELGNELQEAIKHTRYSLEHTADLLVSYPNTLLAAGNYLKPGEGSWGIDTTVGTQLEEQLRQTVRQFIWLTMMQPVVATYECADEEIGRIAKQNKEAVMNTLVNYPEWIQRQSPRTYNLYDTYIALAMRNEKDGGGWPKLLKSALTKRLFGEPDSEPGAVGFLPPYLMADSLAEESEPQTEEEEEFYGPVFPTSAGLLHETRGFGLEREEAAGLARRAEWSDYTPSCGKGQSAKWSDPEYYGWAEP